MNSPKFQINSLPEFWMNIEIKINEKSDVNSFYESIFSEKYLTKWWFIKKLIFNLYPNLSSQLSTITDEEERKKIIYDFVHGLYVKYDSQLQNTLQNLTLLFKNNKELIIAGLSETMDFDPQDIPHIIINPSFKPNSSFWTDKVSLSIVSEILYKKPRSYIDIFVHEITHIIWNQKIWKVYDVVWKLWSLAHEDLKEIVTPVIMRDSCFKNILTSEYMKNANEKQQLLNINIDGVVYNIVDYFEIIYQDMKGKWNTFEKIMEVFVNIFLKIEDQIISKHAIYNECWFASKDKEEALKILESKWYMDPIIL